MTHLLGRQDCVESLRRDLIDLQGAVLDVFSRTGPVRFHSWKFPDKLSCNLDLVSLLEQYDFVDGEEEFNQHSHIVLLELVIDRLLLLLQSFNVHAEQLKCGQKREYTQQTGPCVSIGLVVRHYWNNLVQLGNKQGMSKDIQEVTKTTKCQEKTNFSSASSPQSTVVSTPTYPPQKRVIDAPPCPTHRRPSNIPSCSPLISTDTRSVSCQTVVSSLVPCDACAQVQSSLRESGDALVELCQSEGLPSSLQRLLVAVDDTMGQGRLTACDVAQWSTEQRRDMGRVGKHLQEVRATVQPLRDRLLAAEGEREEFRSQMGTAQEDLKHERSKHQASLQQLEQRHQEAQTSWDKTERRMQEEQKEFKRGTVSLEDSNSRLNAELSLQRERLHTLECERDELQQQVKALQVEEETWHKLEERSQTLEAQLSSAQLLLDKEKAKYQNACRQQESIQVKQRSLLERVDALDQECEELRGELGESEYRQTDLQDQLKHISEEKEQLQAQLIQQQALCSELQAEKQRLEVHVDKLKCTVVQLRGEVQELAKRERLLVAFPELNPLPQGPPQSTGDVLLDMEQQLQANGVRIRILEQENATLHSSLVKLREMAQHGGSKMTSPQQLWNHCKPDTPRESQQNPSSYVQRSPLKTSSAGVRKHGVTRKGDDDGDTVPVAMGPCAHVSTAASSLSATSSTSLLSHQTLTLSPDTAAAKTYAKIRQASRARSSGTHQKRK